MSQMRKTNTTVLSKSILLIQQLPRSMTFARKEYARLDEQGQVYLDYTGGGLYAASQIQKHMELLAQGVFGNPHSSNPTSRAATQLDERARAYVLRYFNANPDEYLVVFTRMPVARSSCSANPIRSHRTASTC